MRFMALTVLAMVLPLGGCAQEAEHNQSVESISDLDEQRQELRAETNSLLKEKKGNLFLEHEMEKTVAELNQKRSPYADLLSDGKVLSHSDESVLSTGPLPISCSGVAQQGGAVLCQTEPNAKVKIARGEDDFYYENANAAGQLIVGFDRDETTNFIEYGGERVTFDLSPRDYDTSRIDGLPPSQVSTFSEAQLKRIRASSARKKTGFASRAAKMGFKDGFIYPVKDFTKTTNFGAQRILNGEAKRPHYGVDLAAPTGTPIYAPADGVVSLADDDLYFEGAMVLLDHGQGLISMYLHTDEILVEPGQAVKQGEKIATVGSKGRSTGPHLCWRLKWRNRNLDPELLTQWPSEG